MRNAKEIEGICLSCKEWTTVHESCCGALVYCEGHEYDPDNYCEHCGEELERDHKCEEAQ